MLYRKYKAVAYTDRTCKTPPSNGFETDKIADMHDFLWKYRQYNETYEITCRESDEKFIIYPEQVNNPDKLLEILTKIYGECNCQ